MSALPKPIQKSATLANKMHAEAYNGGAPPEMPTTLSSPDALLASLSAAAPTEAAELAAPTEAAELDAPAEAAPAEAEAEPAPAEPAPIEPAADEDWKHKYDTLTGKYNAEVPRLNNDIRALQDQISTLHQTLSELKKPEEGPAPVAPAPLTLLKDEEVSEYGADMISMVKRAAMEAMMPELDALKAENARLTTSLGGVTARTAQDARSAMYSGLTQTVPEWEQINTTPEFLEWLGTRDVYTGVTRRDLLGQAFGDNDTARVTAFFQGYQNEHAALTPSNPTPALARKPAVDMSTIAAPGKPKAGGAARTQKGKRVWRQAEISAFYSDVRRGAYKQDKAAKAAIEKDIIDAGPEGRILA